MVDDLLASGILDRLSKKDLFALLGPPIERDGGAIRPHGAKDCDLHYLLGLDWIGIDNAWLFIDLDDKDLVSRYWVYTD